MCICQEGETSIASSKINVSLPSDQIQRDEGICKVHMVHLLEEGHMTKANTLSYEDAAMFQFWCNADGQDAGWHWGSKQSMIVNAAALVICLILLIFIKVTRKKGCRYCRTYNQSA